jgi:hypothetical protein
MSPGAFNLIIPPYLFFDLFTGKTGLIAAKMSKNIKEIFEDRLVAFLSGGFLDLTNYKLRLFGCCLCLSISISLCFLSR